MHGEIWRVQGAPGTSGAITFLRDRLSDVQGGGPQPQATTAAGRFELGGPASS